MFKEIDMDDKMINRKVISLTKQDYDVSDKSDNWMPKVMHPIGCEPTKEKYPNASQINRYSTNKTTAEPLDKYYSYSIEEVGTQTNTHSYFYDMDYYMCMHKRKNNVIMNCYTAITSIMIYGIWSKITPELPKISCFFALLAILTNSVMFFNAIIICLINISTKFRHMIFYRNIPLLDLIRTKEEKELNRRNIQKIKHYKF